MRETPKENVEDIGLSEHTAQEAPAIDETLTPVSTPDPLKETAVASRSRAWLIAGLFLLLGSGGVYAAAVFQQDLRQTWDRLMDSMASSGEESSYVSPPARAVNAALVNIHSDPPGAQVVIDGRQAGITPVTGQRLAPGPHQVEVAMDGYVSVDTIMQAGTTGHLGLAFSLKADELTVEEMPSTPFNSTPINSTPTIAAAPADNPIESQPRQAAPAATPSSGVQTASVDRELGEIIVADPTESNSSLYVDVAPHGARVIVSGRYVGRTPLEVGSLAAGRHLVRIEHDGFQELEQSVDVTAESRSALTASLAPLTGSVRITVLPWGTIYVGERLIAAETDHSHEVEMPVGMLRVRASHPSLGTVERMVRILEGQTVDMILDLNEAVDR